LPHPLDNPVWNALVSGNSGLALGTDDVKFFDDQVSPFAAFSVFSKKHFMDLHDLHMAGRTVLLWSAEQLDIPKEWKVVDCIPGLQMVFQHGEIAGHQPEGIIKLQQEHVPEMVALTKLTKPGPFGNRTIEFGNYEGIFADGKLVAMTGRRFHPFDHIEISAVCTHPGYLGKGYARQLLISQAKQILEESSHPHLHVREDNERAISVYRSIGFEVRMSVFFYVLRK
jgi:ribosomal protein S18 acetylase RimI-like enzyme